VHELSALVDKISGMAHEVDLNFQDASLILSCAFLG